jgi:cytochrome c oxidase subunit 2
MPTARTCALPLALSTTLLAAALVLELRSAGQETAPTAPEPRVVEIVARRFAFEPSEIQARVGERLRLVVTSADGVHGLEIERFRVNREIPRGGKPVTIEFVASEAGRFSIRCSEYCGEGHEDMKGVLVVSPAPLARRAVPPGPERSYAVHAVHARQ